MTDSEVTITAIEQIFRHIIYPQLSITAEPTNTPIGYVLGGQPGAGKNHLTQVLLSQLNHNAMVINGDDFRSFHPNFAALYEKYGVDTPHHTAAFAGKITEMAIAKASSEGFNLIIEGTFRTAEVPLNTLRQLQARGYQTGVAIMAVHPEISWQGVNERFEKQKNNGIAARMTPREHHDLVVKNLATNADTVFHQGNTNRFLVFTRENCVFDSRTSHGLPSDIIHSIHRESGISAPNSGHPRVLPTKQALDNHLASLNGDKDSRSTTTPTSRLG